MNPDPPAAETFACGEVRYCHQGSLQRSQPWAITKKPGFLADRGEISPCEPNWPTILFEFSIEST
jgi:hypothetical protein